MSSPLSTHILDTRTGRPAAGVCVIVEFRSSLDWAEVSRGTTNADGRIMDLMPKGAEPARGLYRLVFDTASYFSASGVKAFYPTVTVTFEISDLGHTHIPLLLSPFGYTTYRGS